MRGHKVGHRAWLLTKAQMKCRPQPQQARWKRKLVRSHREVPFSYERNEVLMDAASKWATPEYMMLGGRRQTHGRTGLTRIGQGR